MRFYFLLIIIAFTSLQSCEKEVNLNLKTAEPRLVIDASMGLLQPCYVRLLLTQDYWDQTAPKMVSGAVITIADESGYEDMIEVEKGVYVSGIVGQLGQTYTLTVEVDGILYEATETFPPFVPINEIALQKIDTGGEIFYFPLISFDNPKGEEANYYYYSLTINGNRMQQVNVESDKYFSDNLEHEKILFFDDKENDDEELKVGDEVTVEMQSIGEGAYTFYNTITSPGGMPNSNPVSNFSGNVLGMFKTYCSSYISMTVTEEDMINARE